MGLHTWFYDKVDLEKLNLSDMVEKCINELEYKINFLQDFLNINNEEEKKDLTSSISIEDTIKHYKKIYNFLVSNNRKKKIKLLKLYEELFEDYMVYNNKLYIDLNSKELTDCFRSWEKNKPLENLEETFLLLSKSGYGELTFDNNGNIIKNIIDIQKIINFWEKHPNGLICFI